MKQLPTLYKITSFGALQEWSVYVEGNRYWTCHGQTGGTIQRSASTVCTGKNAGRANATTGCQQAELEAAALHTKKLKKDYTQDPNVVAGQTSELIEGGILPMLAHKFGEHGDKLKYPCFVQPKLDGHRCISWGPDLWSRTRKKITGCPHVVEDIELLDRVTQVPLDGELYNHEYRNRFEELTHFIRQTTPKRPDCEVVQYHIYDACMPGTFRERLAYLDSILEIDDDTLHETQSTGCIKLVETREVQNEDELMLAFEDFLAQGYEGAIARNADGLYVNKRSYDLLKIKKFDDAEFLCVGVEEGKGKMAGHAIFVCQLPGSYEKFKSSGEVPWFGRIIVTCNLDAESLRILPDMDLNTNDKISLFKAKMKGDHAALAKYVEHPELVVGKLVTVKYQGLTNKNGVPRFPVALRIRETE